MQHRAYQPETDSLALDTLAAKRVDRSGDYPFRVYCTPDSLRLLVRDEEWQSRDVSAEEIFGQQSILITSPAAFTPERQTLTGNVVYQGFVLTLALTYAILLYRNLGDIRTLLDRISRDAASGERIAEDPGSNGFSRFLNITSAIGMLFIAVLIIKYSDSLIPTQLTGMLPHTAIVALSLLTLVAWCGIMLYQTVLMRVVGAITLSEPFIAQLALIKRSYFALLVIITSPPLLLFALCPHGTGNVWFYTVLVATLLVIFGYLKETLNLFLAKKISILHWFLYLCIVEILPISFLCLLAVR